MERQRARGGTARRMWTCLWLPLVCARALLRSLLCGHATFLHSLRAGGQYLGKTDLVLRAGGRRYMIFGPPDKIHVGLSSVTPTVPVLALLCSLFRNTVDSAADTRYGASSESAVAVRGRAWGGAPHTSHHSGAGRVGWGSERPKSAKSKLLKVSSLKPQ